MRFSSCLAGMWRSVEQALETDRERLWQPGDPPTASSTPGMKELRSIESWRIESVWPSPPKITSWWATRPGSRTEWIGSCTLPPAPEISSAVRLAVPEGLSSLRS